MLVADVSPLVPPRIGSRIVRLVPPALGCSASVSLDVTEADTAVSARSGDVPVLATPRVVAIAEEAAVAALGNSLDAGATTVGYEVQLTHIAPTPVGGRITADAVLESIDGRRLCFRVSVTDARGLVAAGRITRVVVVRERFIERARGD